MKSLPLLTSKDDEVSDDLFDVITEGILSDAISADQEPIGEENLDLVQVPHGNPSPKSTTSPRRLDTGPDSGTWDYLRINYSEQSGGSHGKDANVPNDVMYPNQPHELLEGALFDPRTGLPLPQVATVVENITTNYDYGLVDANSGNAVDWGIEQQIIDYQKRRLRQFSICRRIVGIILILIGIALLIFSAVQTSRHVKAYSAWSKSGLPPFNGNPTDPKNTLPEVDPNLAPENKPLPKPREKKKEEVPSDQKPSSDTEPEPEKPKVVINKDYITRHAEKYRKNILEEDEEEDPLYHHGKRPGVVGEEEISGTLINRAKQVGIENKNLVLLQNNDEFLEKINQELQAADFAGAGEEKFAEWGALFCLLNLKLFTRITKELLDSTSTSNTRAKLFFGVPVTQDFQLRSPGWPYRVLIHAASNLLVSHMRSEHRTPLMKTLKKGKMLLEGDPPLVGIEIEKGRSGWLYLDPYAGSEKKYVEKENLDQYGLEYYKKIIVSLIRQFLEAVSKSKAHKGMNRMTIRIDRRIFLLVMPSCPIELIMSDKYLSESEWELVQKILNWEQSAVDPANVSDEVMYSNSEEAVDAYNRYVLLFCSRFFWMTLLEVLKDEYKSAVTSWIPTLRDAKPGDRFEVFQELFMSTSPGEFLVSCKFAGLAVYTPPQLVPLTERLVSDLILGKPHTTEDLQSIVTLVTEGFKFNENWMERAKIGEPGVYENILPVKAEHDSWYMSPTRYHTRKPSGAAANVVPVVDPSSSDEAAVSEGEPSAPSE